MRPRLPAGGFDRRHLETLRNALFGGVKHPVQVQVAAMSASRARGNLVLARLIETRLQRKYGIFISHKAEFPSSLRLKHPVGTVIGEGVKIGEDVTIFQGVTLGGARMGDSGEGNYPEVGDGTVIFAGAVVVGRVRVGKNCVIGANAVVTKDVPDNSTAVGVPARVVSRVGGL